MNPELKHAIRQRDRWIGFGLLALMTATFLPSAYFVYSAIEKPHLYEIPFGNEKLGGGYVVAALVGLLVSFGTVTTVWFALSVDSFIRRLMVLFGFLAVGWGVWFLGCVNIQNDLIPIRAQEMEPVLASAAYSLFVLGMTLPLVWFRTLFSRALASIWEPVPPKRQLGIFDLILWTGLFAFVSACARIATSLFESIDQALLPMAILFGCGFGISLIVILPAVLLLCSSRMSFMIGSVAVLAVTTLGATFLGIQFINKDPMMLPTGVFIATLTFIYGMATIRFFGFRIMKQDKLVKDGPKSRVVAIEN